MRIGVNTIHLTPGGGEEDTYLREAMRALREAKPDWEFIFFTDPQNHDSYDGWERICVNPSESRFTSSESLFRRVITSAAVDRLLSPAATAPIRCPSPIVPFIVSLGPLDESGEDSLLWSECRIKDLKRVAEKASVMVAASEYARKRLLNGLGMPLDRIVVAGPGVGHICQLEPPPHMVEEPYLLALCQGQMRNRASMQIRAFERISRDIPHTLVLLGETEEEAPASITERIIRLSHCPAEQLPGLYRYADLVLYPAVADPSGMTVIEALHCGARILTGKTGAIPEMARSAPFYCDPLSESALSALTLHAISESAEQREHRTKSGRQIAGQHTWRQCAERLVIALQR